MSTFLGHVALKGHFGKFLSAGRGGSSNCDADKILNFEVFDLYLLGFSNNGTPIVGLKSHEHNKWLCAEPSGNVVIDRPQAAPWESFEMYQVTENSIALKSCHGKWLCNEHSNTVCNRDRRCEWEEWYVYVIPADKLPGGGPNVFGIIGSTILGAGIGFVAAGGNPVGAIAGGISAGVASGQAYAGGETVVGITGSFKLPQA